MVISAQDGGGLVALVNAKVNISVVAGLVAPPVFEQAQYYFTVSEDALRGTVLGTVQASTKTGEDNSFYLDLLNDLHWNLFLIWAAFVHTFVGLFYMPKCENDLISIPWKVQGFRVKSLAVSDVFSFI